MGDFRVRPIRDQADRHRMYRYALRDIATFEEMWQAQCFSTGPTKIGAEQELCLVDAAFQPARTALNILDKVDDRHYTNELALFNLEINLDPETLVNSPFTTTEQKLLALLDKGKAIAAERDAQILLAGILPTIAPRHLAFEYMTPIPRYRTISKMLYDIRGASFEIYLQGIDDLIASTESILFEACNTSFQLHLQISPAEFVDKFNWSQMIAGPVLAACVNSPLLFGRELWAESRIAVFKQSLDTRNSKNHFRQKQPRVYFGNGWLYDSPANLWKNELIRFPLLLTSDDLQDAPAVRQAGDVPDLRAIRLHNGTTYTWNRLCYGPGKTPHLRIECRYLPAGPSAIDEMANFAFWVGLMHAIPANWAEQKEFIHFKTVKNNFIKAARYGLQTMMEWMGKSVPVTNLILDTLLPMAEQGLQACQIDPTEIKKYLGIIEQRVRKGQTGAEWMVQSYRKNSAKYSPAIARQELIAQSLEYQTANVPVHEWRIETAGRMVTKINQKEVELSVHHLMSTDVYTINEAASIELARHILEWNNIHHLPVENYQGELVGILTDGMLMRAANHSELKYVSEIMKKEVITADEQLKIDELIQILQNHQLAGLPVIRDQKVVGVITLQDLIRAGYRADQLSPHLNP